MAPLFKRNHENMSNAEMGQKVTTAKYTTLKISPGKHAGAIRRTRSDIGEKV